MEKKAKKKQIAKAISDKETNVLLDELIKDLKERYAVLKKQGALVITEDLIEFIKRGGSELEEILSKFESVEPAKAKKISLALSQAENEFFELLKERLKIGIEEWTRSGGKINDLKKVLETPKRKIAGVRTLITFSQTIGETLSEELSTIPIETIGKETIEEGGVIIEEKKGKGIKEKKKVELSYEDDIYEKAEQRRWRELKEKLISAPSPQSKVKIRINEGNIYFLLGLMEKEPRLKLAPFQEVKTGDELVDKALQNYLNKKVNLKLGDIEINAFKEVKTLEEGGKFWRVLLDKRNIEEVAKQIEEKLNREGIKISKRENLLQALYTSAFEEILEQIPRDKGRVMFGTIIQEGEKHLIEIAEEGIFSDRIDDMVKAKSVKNFISAFKTKKIGEVPAVLVLKEAGIQIPSDDILNNVAKVRAILDKDFELPPEQRIGRIQNFISNYSYLKGRTNVLENFLKTYPDYIKAYFLENYDEMFNEVLKRGEQFNDFLLQNFDKINEYWQKQTGLNLTREDFIKDLNIKQVENLFGGGGEIKPVEPKPEPVIPPSKPPPPSPPPSSPPSPSSSNLNLKKWAKRGLAISTLITLGYLILRGKGEREAENYEFNFKEVEDGKKDISSLYPSLPAFYPDLTRFYLQAREEYKRAVEDYIRNSLLTSMYFDIFSDDVPEFDKGELLKLKVLADVEKKDFSKLAKGLLYAKKRGLRVSDLTDLETFSAFADREEPASKKIERIASAIEEVYRARVKEKELELRQAYELYKIFKRANMTIALAYWKELQIRERMNLRQQVQNKKTNIDFYLQNLKQQGEE